ncbi:MAG: carboxypeptidase regulatory-like domain-containing protein [Acidobacteria bacterium]|nr:carboxypeptidase regulatory-like domain-containing protein [Acidobacteriota bacterium]
MSKVRLSGAALAALLLAGGVWTAPTVIAQGTGTIAGTVYAADGAPMEGVIASVRASHETWTTSVFTDRQGNYSFPSLSAGQYSMWAQAKGYDIAKVEFTLAGGGRVSRRLTLAPLTDPMVIARQLDGPEWFAALPETTTQDRRMKHLLRNNCTACHGPAYTLAPRFDERGWRNIIDLMARGVPPTRGPGQGNPTWQAYKDELAEYLGRVSKDLQPRPGPRPTGAATQLVVTEYDIPRQGRPISAHTGTFWTEGQSTRYESKGARDIWVDSKGNLWVSDDRSIGRTTGKLDPRTGRWTDYALPNARGVASSSHGIWGDRRTDHIFQGGQPDGAILMFDTNREEFVHFARPDTLPRAGGHIDVDSQGNAWAPGDGGALRLNPKTGEYTFYPVPYLEGTRPSEQNQYGIAVDAQDNVWLARAGTESVAWLEPKTGKTGHVKFEPMVFPGLTEKDRTVAVGMNNGPPNGKGPRRLGSGGRNGGSYVWVALNKSDAVAKIDIRSRRVVKEYPLPEGSAPYFATVDRNGMVWVPAQNADRIFKLNPATEQMTEYQLPTRGTDLRHLTVDDSTNPPTVWITYNRSNKIARLQERSAGTQSTASR